jgi:hypothetical protein
MTRYIGESMNINDWSDIKFCGLRKGVYNLIEVISINPYKLIQTFFVMILKNIFIFFKIRQIIGKLFLHEMKKNCDQSLIVPLKH